MHHQPNDHALVIGINDYPNYGSRGWNLNGAVRDAQSFADWLTDCDTGGGLPAENVHLITSTPNPLAPMKHDVDQSLSKIWEAVKENPGRRFYFFFAGHGQSITADAVSATDVALCLPPWSRQWIGASLSSQQYWQVVQRCMPFSEIAVFLDCCRSRSLRALTQNSDLGCERGRDGREDVAGLVLYAAEDETQAFEAETESGELRGNFTRALLAALRGGAAQDEGGVTQEALTEYLEAEMPRLAASPSESQTPKTKLFGAPGTFVFGAAQPGGGSAAAPGHVEFSVQFSGDRVGPILLLGPDAKPLRQGMPADGPWEVSLPMELHTLVDAGCGQSMALQVRPDMEASHVTF